MTISAVVVAGILGYSFWPIERQPAVTNHVIRAEGTLLANVVLPQISQCCIAPEAVTERTDRQA